MMQSDEHAEENQGEAYVEDSWADFKHAPMPAGPLDYLCGTCDGDAVIQDNEGNCFQVPRRLPEPKLPSLELQRRHNLAHGQYASLCPHRVMGRRNHYLFYSQFARSRPSDLSGRDLYPSRRTFASVLDMKDVDAYAVPHLSNFIEARGSRSFGIRQTGRNLHLCAHGRGCEESRGQRCGHQGSDGRGHPEVRTFRLSHSNLHSGAEVSADGESAPHGWA